MHQQSFLSSQRTFGHHLTRVSQSVCIRANSYPAAREQVMKGSRRELTRDHTAGQWPDQHVQTPVHCHFYSTVNKQTNKNKSRGVCSSDNPDIPRNDSALPLTEACCRLGRFPWTLGLKDIHRRSLSPSPGFLPERRGLTLAGRMQGRQAVCRLGLHTLRPSLMCPDKPASRQRSIFHTLFLLLQAASLPKWWSLIRNGPYVSPEQPGGEELIQKCKCAACFEKVLQGNADPSSLSGPPATPSLSHQTLLR